MHSGKFCARRLGWVALVFALLWGSGRLERAEAQAGDPTVVGQWSSVIPWPIVAVHAHVLPNGKVFAWPRYGGDGTVWDPAADTFSPIFISALNPDTANNRFCTGHSFLPDGRLLVTGGHISLNVGRPDTFLFDWRNNSWVSGPAMNDGRWYPTNCSLANGEQLVLSGLIDDYTGMNPLPQVWQNDGTWRSLSDALISLPFYPFLHLAPNGRVFYSGPTQNTRYLDTSGTGAWTPVADSSFGYRDYGSSVLYEDGKVLIMGGHDPPTETAEVIDLNAATPAWRTVSPMAFARRQHTATILPDGKVLVTGGTSAPGFNDQGGAVLPAEMWDSVTESWVTLAAMQVPRIYHSIALLLPDGRVLAAGGGQFGKDLSYDHPNAEIYSPPYLFKGTRPAITTAPTDVNYGQTFFVATPDAAGVAQVSWIRLPSVTHAFNQNQRINRLSFSHTAGGLNVQAPTLANLCPPGHYMLFILNGNGVPSVARIIRIGSATQLPPPVNQPPVASPGGPYTATTAQAIALNGSASSDADGTVASYLWSFGDGTTASGATSSHTYAIAGTYTVTLTVTDNLGTTGSATTTATISAAAAPPGTSLIDDFNDNARDASKWNLGVVTIRLTGWDPAIPVLEQNQRLEIAPRPNAPGNHYNGYVSAVTWNLTDRVASVEVAQIADGGSADTRMALAINPQNAYLIETESGALYFTQVVNGDRTSSSVPYNAVQHRFWRIRHDAATDMILFETSADRVTWTIQRSVARQLAITALMASLGAGTWEPVAMPGTAIFDNFRLEPIGGTPPANQPPVANAGGPYSGTAGQAVSFNGSGSADPDGTITSYQWSFGDGGTGTGSTPAHSYAAAGSYTVTLTVTDNNAATASATTTVTVNASPPPSLSDDFNDNVRDTTKWSFGTIQGEIFSGPAGWDAGIPVLEQNQRLEVSPVPAVAGDHYNGYLSTTTWDLTNAAASVEVVQVAGGGSTDTEMALCLNPQNFYLIAVESGVLYCEQVVGSVRSSTSVTYNPVLHRYWRIRHDPAANTMVFETSGDRVTWTVQRTVARQMAITGLKVELSAGTWEPLGAPGTAIFDSFRLDPNSAPAPNQPPVANAGGPYSGTAGQAVVFNGAGSSDPDGTIASFQWAFGDGGSGTGVTPTHTYAAAGSYTVTLTVTDNRGGTASASATASIAPAAPSGTLTDDFNDNARDMTKWGFGAIQGAWDGTIPVLEQNQRLEISPLPNAGGDHYNGYLSSGTWDLTNAAASVEAIQVAGGVTTDTEMALGVDAADFYQIVYETGRLYFQQVVGGARSSTSVAYSPALHRYWRIRHDPAANTMVFETSGDRVTWTIQRTVARQMAITGLKVELSAGTWEPVGAPGTAIFDNFRLDPNSAPAPNQPPVANVGGPYSGTAGQVVAFNGAGSSDPDGTIVSYQWSFGDGGTSAGAAPTHTYAAAGSYTVTLTVTDNLGASASGSTPASIAPAAPAPSAALSDDFNDNARDTTKWGFGAIQGAWDGTIPVLEQNQRLEISPLPNVGGDHYNGYLSIPGDLTNAAASVEVVQVAGGGSTDTEMALCLNAQNLYMIAVESGWLYFEQVVGGVRTSTMLAYNPVLHRYWRIRHDPATDTILFETSGDRVTWTVQRTVARQMAITGLKVELSAGTWEPVGAPGTAIFDNFRLDPNSAPAPNQPPVANVGGPYSGTAGQAVAFNGAGSSDPDGTIAGYQWSFGDGSTATGAAPTHTYASAGSYTVTLTVTDNRGGTASASTPASIAAPPPAGALSDDFNDNSRDTKWSFGTIQGEIFSGPAGWDAGIPVLEQNQRLEVSPVPGVAGDHYNGYLSTTTWDLTNAAASVEVVQVAGGGSTDTEMALCLNPQNFYMIAVESGVLYCEQVVGSARSSASIAYNPVQHRYWRIRHDPAANTMVFETSGDRVTWTVQRTVARQMAITGLKVELSAGTWEPVGAPGTAIFDNFRLQ